MVSRKIDIGDQARTFRDRVDHSTLADIAELSDAVISRMTHGELVQLIDAAAVHVRLADPPDIRRLQVQDEESLRRLAYLARFACRNLVRCQSCNRP